ncbi:hypothetical protein N7528_002693 [Penicillium herquei]|nr:hypothetical protein N7528_002693 [Penicillium herquei]
MILETKLAQKLADGPILGAVGVDGSSCFASLTHSDDEWPLRSELGKLQPRKPKEIQLRRVDHLRWHGCSRED